MGGSQFPANLKLLMIVFRWESFVKAKKMHVTAEEECWIFSGEWYLCVECNQQIMLNISKLQTKKMN